MLLCKVINGVNFKTINFFIKLFAIFFFILLISQNTFAQSALSKTELTQQELNWIAEHPVVRASSNTALAPFDFISAGQPAGLSIDYLNLIGTKVGLKFDYVNFDTWEKMLENARNKEIDLVHTISRNEEREKYFNFSVPYFNMPIVNFGRVGSKKINSLSYFENKRIGILKGHTIAESYKNNYPQFNLVEFNTHSEAIRALALNEIDIYTAVSPAIEFLILLNNIQGIEIIGNDFILKNNIMDQRIGVHKDNPILMSIVNKAVAAVTTEEFMAISEKWIKTSPANDDIGLSKEEQNWLVENNVIKVSALKSSFPYEFIDEEGRISGISGDLLNEISKRLNVKFVWSGNDDWTDGLLKITSGDAHMLAAITPTKERQNFLEFSDVYLKSPHVIVSRDEGSVFSDITTLDGMTVVQLRETALIGYLSEGYPNIKVVEAETRKEALELVSSGGADAMIETVTVALANISNFGLEDLRIVGATPFEEVTAMGVSSELPLLSSAIRKALANISPETRSAIFAKWLAQRIETKVDYGPLYYVIALATFIIILSFLWVTKLRQQVSRRVQAENNALKAQTKLVRMLAIAPDAIISTDDDLCIQTFNDAAEKVFGFSGAEAMGKPINILIPERFHQSHDSHINKYLHGNNNTIQMEGRREILGVKKDGTEFLAEASVSKFDIGNDTISIVILRDISKRKQFETELIQARELAVNADKAKTEFLANMSHELRTPLNAINGFSEMMLKQSFGPLGNPHYNEYAKYIFDSGNHLLLIINDILDISRIEAGEVQLNKEELDVVEIIEECQHLIEIRAKDKQLKIITQFQDHLPAIRADERMVKQMLLNLLTNAIKFTAKNGEIIIEAVLTKNNTFVLSVIDDGIGMAEDDIPIALAAFGQVDSALNRKFEGTGLGLSLVKSMAELHGGKLILESELGVGTRASIELPVND